MGILERVDIKGVHRKNIEFVDDPGVRVGNEAFIDPFNVFDEHICFIFDDKIINKIVKNFYGKRTDNNLIYNVEKFLIFLF